MGSTLLKLICQGGYHNFNLFLKIYIDLFNFERKLYYISILEEWMASKKMSEGIPIAGIGLIGIIHEFVISHDAELFPIILFSLLVIKGIVRLFEKG